MKRTLLFILIGCLILALNSCTKIPIYGEQVLTIKQVQHLGKKSYVRFNEIKGQALLPTDTIKVGDKVKIKFKS